MHLRDLLRDRQPEPVRQVFDSIAKIMGKMKTRYVDYFSIDLIGYTTVPLLALSTYGMFQNDPLQAAVRRSLSKCG
jgi:hypothetical protein